MNTQGNIHYYITPQSGIGEIREQYHLTSDVVKLILNDNLYPMISHDNHQFFFVMSLPIYDDQHETIDTIEIDVVVTSDHILLFTNEENNTIQTIEQQSDKGTVQQSLYLLINTFCFHTLNIIHTLEQEIVRVRKQVLAEKVISKPMIEQLMELKMNIGTLRSTIMPFIDIIEHIENDIVPKITESPSQRLVHISIQTDHYIKQIQSQSLFLQENITNIADTANALQTITSNNIMKVLAIISSIFIPLSFITGLFGMNFVHLPINNSTIYYSTLIFMVFI